MCDMEAVNVFYGQKNKINGEMPSQTHSDEVGATTATTEMFKVLNVPNERIKRKAKRPSQFLNGSSDSNFSSLNLHSNGTGTKLIKNSRKSRSGLRFGRGLPKKGGAGGKGTWGKLGVELLNEDGSAIDEYDPNYDPDVQTKNCEFVAISPPWSDEEIKNAIEPIIQEYFENADTYDAALSLEEWNAGQQYFKIVVIAVSLAMDRKPSHCELTSVLISDLYGSILTVEDIAAGFTNLLNDLPDLVLDTPDAPNILGNFIARVIADDCLPPKYVQQQKEKYDCDYARAALNHAATLLNMKHGLVRLDNVWGVGGGIRPVKYLIKKMVMLLKEYLSSSDIEEGIRCIRELEVPHFHHELVFEAVIMVLEDMSEQTQELMCMFLKSLYASVIITPEQLNEFLAVLDQQSDYNKGQIEEMNEKIMELCEHLNQNTFTDILHDRLFETVAQQFGDFLNNLRQGNGTLAAFWMSYIDMVELMLKLLRASREGNWKLYLTSIHEMIPWCFSYDNINYARYLSAYYAEMTNLPEEHPEIHDYLEAGGFSVQIGSKNTFGKIPVDQTVEETVNRDTQTQGGTKGFSLKANALSRYYLTAEYRSSYLRRLKDMLNINQSDQKHNDLQASRIAKDELDVKNLTDMIESSWINPFSNDYDDLVSISTGRVAPKEVVQDLCSAYKIGQNTYIVFREERLQNTPPLKNFHDPLQKQKLKTFSSTLEKTHCKKQSSTETILKANRNLFARMILIASSRNLDMREILSHPLGPVPWALATADGALRKTSKPALAKELQRNVPPAEITPAPSACLIDGMALKRIDIIFNVYKENSIKDAERIRRGASKGIEFKNITAGHSVQQWKRFLASTKNKENLIQLFIDEWRQPKYTNRLNGKMLYVTCKDLCYKITSNDCEVLEELQSSQEEADTRIFLHCAHAASAGFETLKIVSETDVFVLCLAFCEEIPSQLFQKSGTQARIQYIDIHKVANVFGTENCKALLGLHAITGCDTVSAFAGRGKVNAIKLLKSNTGFRNALKDLGSEWKLKSGLLEKLEEFVCHIYNARASTNSISELRYRLFCAKNGEIESWQLPPCAAALRKHIYRANYQTAIWRRSLEKSPDIPSPVGNGWCMQVEEDGKQHLLIDWLDVAIAPDAVLQLLSCKCSRTCKNPACPCLENGLRCTDLCRLLTCNNQAVVAELSDNDCEDDSDMDDGFERVYKAMPDISIDVPFSYNILEKFVTKCKVAGFLSDAMVKKMPARGRKRFVSEGDGGKIKEVFF
ncbi:Programmed cell death protein 4 [Nymphon striatum]|nr:Programmed cell death protein 4 [Nymphon striatum]